MWPKSPFTKKNNSLENEHFFIKDKVNSILKWIKDQSELNNEYLWGGTLGPNFDCSGLIQTAFLKHQILLLFFHIAFFKKHHFIKF